MAPYGVYTTTTEANGVRGWPCISAIKWITPEGKGGMEWGSFVTTLELTNLPSHSSPCAGGHLEHGDHSNRAGGHESALPRDVSNEGPAEDHSIGPTQTRITSQVVRIDLLHTHTHILGNWSTSWPHSLGSMWFTGILCTRWELTSSKHHCRRPTMTFFHVHIMIWAWSTKRNTKMYVCWEVNCCPFLFTPLAHVCEHLSIYVFIVAKHGLSVNAEGWQEPRLMSGE